MFRYLFELATRKALSDERFDELFSCALSAVNSLSVGATKSPELNVVLKEMERYRSAYNDIRANLAYLNGERRYTPVRRVSPQQERYLSNMFSDEIDTLKIALYQIKELGYSPYLQRFNSSNFSPATRDK